jgi:ABC-type bacteriocin/lantibiotic exporter with double-glycine peptidase domain
VNRFFQPIQLLVQQYNSYQQGQASVIKLRTLLENEPTVSESADAIDLPTHPRGDPVRPRLLRVRPGRPGTE